MRQPYELSIALRYLRARSSHSFISFISAVSMIGIGLAVAVLIVVLSVMNGFEYELQQRILGDGVGCDDRRLRRAAGRLAGDAGRGHCGVRTIPPPRRSSKVRRMAVAGESLAGVIVRGVDPELERRCRASATRSRSAETSIR